MRELTRSALEVTFTPPSQPDRVQGRVERWFTERARWRLTERYEYCVESLRPFGIAGGSLAFRRMKGRWGSCSARRRVLLNPALIKAKVDCIDYVIIHELCHWRCHHHGPEFYQLLARVLPDWKRRKARLERWGAT